VTGAPSRPGRYVSLDMEHLDEGGVAKYCRRTTERPRRTEPTEFGTESTRHRAAGSARGAAS